MSDEFINFYNDYKKLIELDINIVSDLDINYIVGVSSNGFKIFKTNVEELKVGFNELFSNELSEVSSYV